MSAREYFVYRAFDAEGRLLYVGMSKHLRQRRSYHRHSAVWFKDAVRFRLDGPLPLEVARELECWRILREGPIYNKRRTAPRVWFRDMRDEQEARRAVRGAA